MKKQKPTQGALKRLLALYNGEELTQSETQTRMFDKMKREGVLVSATQHGSRTTYKAVGLERLKQYLSEELSIQDLQSFHDFIFSESESSLPSGGTERGFYPPQGGGGPLPSLRAEQGVGYSPRESAGVGFFVTSVEPITAQVGGMNFTINPPRGTYFYIYEYKMFSVPRDVIIVGVDSEEVFHRIRSFLNIFPQRKLLFIHRHPQGPELARWLKTVNNQYIHFADFDFNSIYTFQHDIYSRIGERASFLVPGNVEELIERGSRRRYDMQKAFYRNVPITDLRLKPLVELIDAHHRCYSPEDDFEH